MLTVIAPIDSDDYGLLLSRRRSFCEREESAVDLTLPARRLRRNVYETLANTPGTIPNTDKRNGVSNPSTPIPFFTKKKSGHSSLSRRMVDDDIIQLSMTSWLWPVVPVKKLGGGLPFCVGYSKLKNIVNEDENTLQNIFNALDTLEFVREHYKHTTFGYLYETRVPP